MSSVHTVVIPITVEIKSKGWTFFQIYQRDKSVFYAERVDFRFKVYQL